MHLLFTQFTYTLLYKLTSEKWLIVGRSSQFGLGPDGKPIKPINRYTVPECSSPERTRARAAVPARSLSGSAPGVKVFNVYSSEDSEHSTSDVEEAPAPAGKETKGKGKGRAVSKGTGSQPSHPTRAQQVATTFAKVTSIKRKLEDLHGSKYTDLQLTSWAHMVDVGYHHSLAVAPSKKLFQRRGQSAVPVTDSASTSGSSSQGKAGSATESAQLQPGGAKAMSSLEQRAECLKQLAQLGELHRNGVLTEEQFSEQREGLLKIMAAVN